MAESPTYTLAQIIALAKGTTNWYNYAKSTAQHGKNAQDDISTLQSAAFSGATPGWNAAIDTRWYVVDSSSSTTTYTGTTSPTATGSDSLFTGYFIVFKAATTNTGTSTLNVGSADGAVNIKKMSSGAKAALTAGDLDSDNFAELIFDGTDWILLNPPAAAPDTTSLEDDIAILGFKVAANGSLAKYNLVDQTIDDFQDTSGVNAGGSTNESRNASNYYSGAVAGTVTGGTITTHGVYTVHTFTANGNFITDVAGTADVLLVGGGGSGGGGHANNGSGGGGGAGGARELASQSVSAATHAIVIGAGATGAQYGANGNVSSIVLGSTLSASGGGGGGYGTDDTSDTRDGIAGASGGGGGIGVTAKVGGSGNSGGYTPVEGYAGGNASGAYNGGAGGGGGAGAVGGAASASAGGNGGNGIQNAYRTGSNVYYGGGGGGSGYTTQTSGSGGQGGGGGAGTAGSNTGNAGTVNTGGGGGGAHGGNSSHWSGGSGGSGIAVVRYNTSTGFVTYSDMTLVSTTTTAQAAPTKGDIVFTYTNGAGTTTLGTDVTAEYSADGGSTWTSMTLGSEGTTGGHNIATAHDVSLTSTSGTSMAYRIKTLNQSASKTTRIQAVSLGWS